MKTLNQADPTTWKRAPQKGEPSKRHGKTELITLKNFLDNTVQSRLDTAVKEGETQQ